VTSPLFRQQTNTIAAKLATGIAKTLTAKSEDIIFAVAKALNISRLWYRQKQGKQKLKSQAQKRDQT